MAVSTKLLTKRKTLAVSSKNNNPYNNGSEFILQLDQELDLPKSCVQAQVYLDKAVLWNNFPNVEAPDNTLLINDNGLEYTITFPTGLYSLSDINSEVSRQLLGAGSDVSIQLTGNSATQRVIITFLKAGVTITFSAGTIWELLGFNLNDVVGPSVLVNQYETGSNVARFNKTEYLYLEMPSFVLDGFSYDGSRQSNIVAMIPIDVSAGAQINFNAGSNPDKVDVTYLTDAQISQIKFKLVDQNRLNINTLGESVFFKLILEYTLAISYNE